MTFEEFYDPVRNYFSAKGWVLNRCNNCNRFFLAKNVSNNCGRLECGNHLVFDSNKRKNIKPCLVLSKMEDYFGQKGYTKKILPNVKNHDKDTAFVVAAIQIFNHQLVTDEEVDQDKILCPQPCVRLRSFPSDYSRLGFVRSFINVATLKLGASVIQYCEYLDDWVGYMSQIGVYASKIKIVFCENYVNIRNLYFGYGVDFNIDGLELGHCNYYDQVVSKNNVVLTGIDCGFCIERILWLLNGGDFWESLLPMDLHGNININIDVEDLLRTIVLIVMSEIKPGTSNDRYQLRKLLNSYYANCKDQFLMEYNIESYFDYWKTFMLEYQSLEDCKQVIYTYLRKRKVNELICDSAMSHG